MIPLIKIKHLSKTYEKKIIINNLNLSVFHGEFLTLLGPSGCGKTTLLRLISGFENPSSGDIFINEKKINTIPPQKREIHTVFQNYALFNHLSVQDNIAFALHCKNIKKKEIINRVNKILQLVELENFAKNNIKNLSGGQKQRVAIARAIIDHPKVLLLDEPLSSLDYHLRKNMQYELKKLQKKLKITFIFVTHDQEEALSISDRIAILNCGKIEQIGTPKEIYKSPINIYVAKFIGDTNIFYIKVLKINKNIFMAKIESIILSFININNYKLNDYLYLIIRPENIYLSKSKTIQKKNITNINILPGKIIDIIYKGSTINFKILLNSGKIINTIKIFNENNESSKYCINQKIWIYWFLGNEILLPYEKKF
ncbi:polyamine ABC transporter ATP-binding protein [Candidatus Legionella polyplacis]|uniref:Spermidine/putrescine import ATP-binding protein PotA n=1 Tax=Candidatus Legionella polyplacis TaxID=2005262 RepID=A0ABZ2GY09_9GAMM